MAVPTRRTSKSVTKQRRTHIKLAKVNLISCSNCQELILPHRVCSKCGHIHGKQVISVDE
ncbi:MAG: 50S ribosomal protein L32 [SAR324 cluster bacterium]|uniref:Large ribosomal subunit protein bL32 n=1 Tax=SAR324 cluster bacterium TaxID=2024889 RepID=A0A2A4T0T2_9DELT|nr:MAG: 50S ribosomal protein L32 [SAR324 cluster bacterium]